MNLLQHQTFKASIFFVWLFKIQFLHLQSATSNTNVCTILIILDTDKSQYLTILFRTFIAGLKHLVKQTGLPNILLCFNIYHNLLKPGCGLKFIDRCLQYAEIMAEFPQYMELNNLIPFWFSSLACSATLLQDAARRISPHDAKSQCANLLSFFSPNEKQNMEPIGKIRWISTSGTLGLNSINSMTKRTMKNSTTKIYILMQKQPLFFSKSRSHVLKIMHLLQLTYHSLISLQKYYSFVEVQKCEKYCKYKTEIDARLHNLCSALIHTLKTSMHSAICSIPTLEMPSLYQ